MRGTARDFLGSVAADARILHGTSAQAAARQTGSPAFPVTQALVAGGWWLVVVPRELRTPVLPRMWHW
jgi:hypothetical protein